MLLAAGLVSLASCAGSPAQPADGSTSEPPDGWVVVILEDRTSEFDGDLMEALLETELAADQALAHAGAGWIDGNVVGGSEYELYFVGVKGATIGKRVMGIRVQDSTTGQVIGIGRAFVRYLVLAVTGSICFVGYLSPFFDSPPGGRYQGWHDKAASDVVVSTK